MHTEIEKKALVIANPRSGKGQALTYAELIKKVYGFEFVSLENFLQNCQKLLEIYSFFILLAGDGSQASVIRELLKRDVQSPAAHVLLLSLGGEKVFARHLGLMGDPILIIKDVLSGNYSYREVRPLHALTASNNYKSHYLAWSALAGASNLILHEIERNRNLGVNDFQRRMMGFIKGIQQLRINSAYAFATINHGEMIKALDIGMTSSSIPGWTSHFNFNVYSGAILHMVAVGLDIDKDFDIISRGLILDFILNRFGLKSANPVVDYKEVKANDCVEIYCENGLSFDSEPSYQQNATLSLAPTNSYSPVLMISRNK